MWYLPRVQAARRGCRYWLQFALSDSSEIGARMPASSTRIALWLLAASCLASACLGCRAFRCQQVSDEAIAATRQLSLQGMDAQQRGRWDQAESLFAQAVITCPRDERARCGYAQSLWHRGAREQAVTHMEE